MISANAGLTGSYDPLQVALSVLIAISASYAALDLAGRVTATSGRARLIWLIGGSTAMGIGIWAMHYVGMLAFRLPVLLEYDWPTVLLSLLVGILCSAFALVVVSRKRMGLTYALYGSVIMGCGIAGLHYVAMAAMRLPAECRFDFRLVALSVVLAVLFSFTALWLEFYFRDEPKNSAWRKLGSALVMGVAISAMHYTGMAAATFIPAASAVDQSHAVTISSLGTLGIAAATLQVLGLAVLSSLVDRRFDAQALELALAETRLELAHVARIATMGELTASIAHEINQPLTAVVNYGNFAMRQVASGAPNLQELRETIVEIVNDGTRASAVISRIRALLQKGAPDRIGLDINEVIREVMILVRHEATQSRVSVRLDLAADVPRVLGDRVQLQQVLINLVVNSIEAMRTLTDRPRELLIKSAKNADAVLIKVQDSGKGLDPEQAGRIFEPFFTTKPQGIGMGLSISRSIIESHGGRLWTVTRSSGALFQFTLPINGNCVV
ncbi:MAG: MHYT domain-containing protein [Candidatus Sulfotelmatobacter sp.]